MYPKLLVAIDPEDDGEGKYALETALKQLEEDGELHLASVYSPGGGSAFFPHVAEEGPEQKEAEAHQTLDLLVRKYLPLNCNVSLHAVAAGSPGETLVDIAGQLGVDLMILVSRGSSGFWPLRRETVEYVAVNAFCPVLVLPALEKGRSKDAPL